MRHCAYQSISCNLKYCNRNTNRAEQKHSNDSQLVICRSMDKQTTPVHIRNQYAQLVSCDKLRGRLETIDDFSGTIRAHRDQLDVVETWKSATIAKMWPTQEAKYCNDWLLLLQCAQSLNSSLRWWYCKKVFYNNRDINCTICWSYRGIWSKMCTFTPD